MIDVNQEIYLRPTIRIEPLFLKWYAWTYLLAPMTSACNMVKRYLPILESFCESPEIHEAAVKDPKLLGGPFMDYPSTNINEVISFLSRTREQTKELIDLYDDYIRLVNIVLKGAEGDSLGDLYKMIPDRLQGLVELCYDINSNVTVRFVEKLFYNKFNLEKYQSIAITDTLTDQRKFSLSSPLINRINVLDLPVPFKDTRIDEFFKLKATAGDYMKIANLMGIKEEDCALFQSFFSNSPPEIKADRNYYGDRVRTRYYGHACIELQTQHSTVLFDPVISYDIANSEIKRFTFSDLPDSIDYVVITHNHQDHILLETLLHIRHKIKKIVVPKNLIGSIQDPSLKLILTHQGFDVIELGELERIDLDDDGFILGLPFFGEHADLNIQSKLAYMVELKGKRFLLAADSNNISNELYLHIKDYYFDKVDYLYIGQECDGAPLTWLYGPLLSQPLKRQYDNNRSLSGSNFERAWSLIQHFNPRNVYVYAMGQEPWLEYVMALKYDDSSIQLIEARRLVEKCKQSGIHSKILFGSDEEVI